MQKQLIPTLNANFQTVVFGQKEPILSTALIVTRELTWFCVQLKNNNLLFSCTRTKRARREKVFNFIFLSAVAHAPPFSSIVHSFVFRFSLGFN